MFLMASGVVMADCCLIRPISWSDGALMSQMKLKVHSTDSQLGLTQARCRTA